MPAHTLTIGASKIETPALFASYRIRDFPRAGLRFPSVENDQYSSDSA